jgi:hypothetical protein
LKIYRNFREKGVKRMAVNNEYGQLFCEAVDLIVE